VLTSNTVLETRSDQGRTRVGTKLGKSLPPAAADPCSSTVGAGRITVGSHGRITGSDQGREKAGRTPVWGSSCVPTLIQPCSDRVRKFSASYLPTILPRLCASARRTHTDAIVSAEKTRQPLSSHVSSFFASSPRTAACPASSERLPGEPEEAASPAEAPSAPPAYIHRCLLRGFRPRARVARDFFFMFAADTSAVLRHRDRSKASARHSRFIGLGSGQSSLGMVNQVPQFTFTCAGAGKRLEVV